MLGIVLIGLYFSTAASMALAPFMFIGHPDKNPLKVLKESSVCMKGKKLEFIRLILSFGSGYASRGYYTLRGYRPP